MKFIINNSHQIRQCIILKLVFLSGNRADKISEIYWDSTYAIVVALIEAYPQHDPKNVGLAELAHMVETLPNFSDDPALVTERILLDIQITWYEEATHL